MVGAFSGHGFQGLNINIQSIYGLIALTGIVVNDSIVLIDQINRNLLLGQKLHDAVYNASLSRLRPILLTTMTTAIGLAPLIFETSRQAKFLIPMAISVAYGLLFGTFILLIILPSGFMALNRLRCVWARMVSREPLTPEKVEPSFREQAEVDNLSVRSNGE